MKGDLHVHSEKSDGSFTRREILKEARKRGLTHLAFTEHDCVKDVKEGVLLGAEYGIRVIPGVEISAMDFETGRKVHILGYGFERGSAISHLCGPILERRHNNALKQIEILNTLGYQISAEAVNTYAGTVLYKQHILRYLTDTGQTHQMYGEIYREVFKNGGPCDFDIIYADAFQAVKAIRQDGGVAVLAHPGQQNNFDLVPGLVQAGLGGIEKYHPDHGRECEEKVGRICMEYDLLETGGSDFHGVYAKTPPTLGSRTTPCKTLEILQKFDLF